MPAPLCRQRKPPAPPSPTRPALRFQEIAFSFEPPVPGFECRILYQVLRALAVIFRQRWEGFQVLAKHLKTGDQAIATQEKRGTSARRRSSLLLLSKGVAWHFARHGRYSSINPAA